MSDEESFVILGTSPMPSLEIDGIPSRYSSGTSSLQSDTPGSRFTSLKSSQISDLQNAQAIGTQSLPKEEQQLKLAKEIEVSKDKDKNTPILTKSRQSIRELEHINSLTVQPEMAELWSRQSKVELFSLDELGMKTPNSSAKQQQPTNQHEHTKEKTTNSIETQTSNVNSSTVQPEMAEPKVIKQNPIQLISLIKSQMDDPNEISIAQSELYFKKVLNQQEEAYNKLWSRQPKVELYNESLSLEELAMKTPNSPAKQQQPTNQDEHTKEKTTNSIETQTPNSQENINQTISDTSNKTTPNSSIDKDLAASFILGEVGADVLKMSVYSQFPSLSMAASPEDVVKLQNMVTEYNDLKDTVAKADVTVKKFHQYALNSSKKIKQMEEFYKQQLESYRHEIEMLSRENKELQNSFKAQIEAVEVARRKDRDETIKIISEKNALLENLRTQIVKLEQKQLASFESVSKIQSPEDREQFQKLYITRREHNENIKQFERKLSELLAQNLDFKDVEKQYIDELQCLKVNLTSAEELIKENKAKINELQANIIDKQQTIEALESSLNALREINNKQSERITLLEHQTEVHRKDFEMERESRQVALKEKQQLLQDLRNLQRHNRGLIEEHQKFAQNYERYIREVTVAGNGGGVNITAANTNASSFYNNPQRPIRNLPSSSSGGPAASAAIMHYCPICNKAFKSLNILQSHVNDCIDKN